jgi:hypothetical protein
MEIIELEFPILISYYHRTSAFSGVIPCAGGNLGGLAKTLDSSLHGNYFLATMLGV